MSKSFAHYHVSTSDPSWSSRYFSARFAAFREALYEANTIKRALRYKGTRLHGRAGWYYDEGEKRVIWVYGCELEHAFPAAGLA